MAQHLAISAHTLPPQDLLAVPGRAQLSIATVEPRVRNIDRGAADGNIHAAVKMLRNIADTYFNDGKLDPTNRTLFVFASYNAGPTRIAGLRKKASAMGLDPNIWFANVELVAAHDVGQETVTYVGNIYKYYVAYKLAFDTHEQREKARTWAGG